MTPDRVGRYELQDVLGTGGFATVYRAVDPRLEATVAVKVLAENWSHQPEVRRRFQSEAVYLRRVQSAGHVPGIVEVFDIDETNDRRPFFVMSYADKGTLYDRAGNSSWRSEHVIPVISALAETIGALHAAGVVHRDIKPSNLMLRSDRQSTAGSPDGLIREQESLVVGDLGMAKDLNRETTALSIAGGTERYMAPEQRDPTATVDHRADIYAASVLVLELLTGRAEAPAEHEREHADRPRTVPEDVWKELESGFAPDRENRHESMTVWKDSLVRALQGVAGATLPNVHADVGSTSTPIQAAARQPVLPQQARNQSTAGRRSPTSTFMAFGALSVLIAVALIAFWTTIGGRSDRISGPDSVVVGETTIFQAVATDDETVAWTDWNGAVIEDNDLAVIAVLPGSLTFSLMVGDETETKTIEVEPSPDGPLIVGPDEVVVGTPTNFFADIAQGDQVRFWIDNDGQQHLGDSFTLEAETVGSVTIALVVRSADGVDRGVRRTLNAEAADS